MGSDTSSTGEQEEYGRASFGKRYGENGSIGSGDDGGVTASKAATDIEMGGPEKVLRVAAAAAGGLRKDIDFGGGPAAPKNAKSSKDRRRPKRRALGDGGRNSSK